MNEPTYASADAEPHSWPTRWTVPRPTFHIVDPDNHLLTGCGQVISGPRWVVVTSLESRPGDGIRVPVDHQHCPCLDEVLEASWEAATLNHDIDPARYAE